MNKAQAIIFHYGEGVADFMIRATGEMEWGGPGLEPTDEECEQWEIERVEHSALAEQKQTCTKRVKDIEYRISNHPPHPEDIEKNKAYIDLLRACAASEKVQDIPKDPFG